MRNRSLRPLATDAVSVSPAVVTDRTCAAVLGLEPRAFREAVARLRIPHRIVGRRMLVCVADFMAAVRGPVVAAVPDDQSATPAPEEIGSADDLLRRIGRRRCA